MLGVGCWVLGVGSGVRTVSDDAFPAILDHAEERRPAHEVVQVETEVIVFGKGVEVCEVEREEVCWCHAAYGAHGCGFSIWCL